MNRMTHNIQIHNIVNQNKINNIINNKSMIFNQKLQIKINQKDLQIVVKKIQGMIMSKTIIKINKTIKYKQITILSNINSKFIKK